MPWMWLFFGELVWLPFQGPASLNGYVVYEKYCSNGEKLSYSCLDPSNHSSMHISTDTKYINPWLKTFEWFLFWIQEENLNMKVLVLYSHFCSCRFFSSATLPSARIVEISPWKKAIFSRKNMAWNWQQINLFNNISALCLDQKDSSTKHVHCTTCMNAQGTFEPPRGQRSPLGQNTSGFVLTCFLIQSAEQGKQNLWWGAVGHCTKCVSSRRCAQMVHFSSGLFGIASASEVMVLLIAVQITAALLRWEKALERKCYIEKAWRCSWSFLLPGVGTLTPFLPISLEEVTWLRVGVPASPGCERELTIDVVRDFLETTGCRQLLIKGCFIIDKHREPKQSSHFVDWL